MDDLLLIGFERERGSCGRSGFLDVFGYYSSISGNGYHFQLGFFVQILTPTI